MKVSPEQQAAASPHSPQAVGREAPSQKHEKLWALSKQFEALLVDQMIQSMRKTVVRGGPVPQSHAEKIYQSMLDSDYSKQIADTEQIGLAKVLYGQLLRTLPGR